MLTLKETNEVEQEVLNQDNQLNRFVPKVVAFQVDNVLEEFDDSPHFVVKSKIDGKVFYQYETNNHEMAELLLKKIS